jgi:hypothetical protein
MTQYKKTTDWPPLIWLLVMPRLRSAQVSTTARKEKTKIPACAVPAAGKRE